MLSRNFGPESLGASGVIEALCRLEQIMSTDPKKNDELKDEELDTVSGGELETSGIPIPPVDPPVDPPLRQKLTAD